MGRPRHKNLKLLVPPFSIPSLHDRVDGANLDPVLVRKPSQLTITRLIFGPDCSNDLFGHNCMRGMLASRIGAIEALSSNLTRKWNVCWIHFDVLPGLAGCGSMNRRLIDPQLLGDLIRPTPFCVLGSNMLDESGVEDCAYNIGPVRKIFWSLSSPVIVALASATFRSHVGRVVRVGSCTDMGGIAAERVIAAVHDELTVRNLALGQSVSDTRRVPRTSSKLEGAISSR